jgi:heat shock protein HslJ
MKTLLLYLFIGLICIGCSPRTANRGEVEENTGQRTDQVLLLNDIWALEAIGEQSLRGAEAADRLERPTLELQLAADRVAGTDGCNQFMGRIEEVGESVLKLGGLVSTKMACLDDGGIPERVMDALARVNHYRITDLQLRLFDTEGEVLLTYRKVD